MAHGYRTLQNWDQWLARQALGHSLVEQEKKLLSQLLKRHYGKHALLIGVPQQHDLFHASNIACHFLMSPLVHRGNKSGDIESDFHELPILTGSIDLVILPHTLEYVDNPRQLLAEACRIVKPEGLIVVCGFNPISIWGLKKLLSKHQSMPWAGNFIHSQKVKSWLQLADFALEKQKSVLFPRYRKLQWLTDFFPNLGGVYVLLARAKVVPLTPIRMRWKQRLGGMRISTTISGHIARRSR